MPRTTPTKTWIALALTLFVIVTRLPALIHPKAIDDEQVYAVVATTMIHGGEPYRDAVERKPPLLFELYQTILHLAGERSWVALHVTVVVWTLATMAVLFLMACRLFDTTTAGWAALLYGLFVVWGDYRSLALNGELLMNLPITAAFAITLGPSHTRLRLEVAVAGALLGIACLLKQPAAIATLPLVLYVLRTDYRRARRFEWRDSLSQAALICTGFLVPLVVTALVFWRKLLLWEAFYWTVLSHQFPVAITPQLFLRNGPGAIAFFALSTAPLLVGAGVSIADGWKRRGSWGPHSGEFTAVSTLLAVSLVAVAINGQFLFHYFLQLMPPLVLLAAPTFTAMWNDSLRWRGVVFRGRYLGPWLTVTAMTFFAVDTIGLALNRTSADVAQYVRAHSVPSDRIFVWGQGDRQVGIYLDAERLPASRYLASYPLTGHVFSFSDPSFDESTRVTPDVWQNLERDFLNHPPRYIVDTDAVLDHPEYPLTRYPYLRHYLVTQYQAVYRGSSGIVYARRTSHSEDSTDP